MVETLSFHCRGHGSIPSQRSIYRVVWPKKKKKEKQERIPGMVGSGLGKEKKKLTMTGLVLGVGILKNSVHPKSL